MNFESGCGISSSQTGACGSGNGASFRGGARTHLRHSVSPTKAVDQRRSSPLLEHKVAAATLCLLLVLFIRKDDDDDEDEAQPTWTWTLAPGATTSRVFPRPRMRRVRSPPSPVAPVF